MYFGVHFGCILGVLHFVGDPPGHPRGILPKLSLRAAAQHCLSTRTTCLKSTALPFVRIHCGNNSKIILLCICICYEIKIMSKIIFICYAVPSKLRRTAVSVSATKNYIQNKYLLYLYLLRNAKLIRKSFFSVCNAIWTDGTPPTFTAIRPPFATLFLPGF